MKVLLAANADINAEDMVSRILSVYMCPKLCWCLFVCFEFFDARFLFFICSKRKEILSNFLFSVFLFVLFLMMANDFFFKAYRKPGDEFKSSVNESKKQQIRSMLKEERNRRKKQQKQVFVYILPLSI